MVRGYNIMTKENLQLLFGAVILVIVLFVAIVILISMCKRKDNTFTLTITDLNGNVSETVIHENLIEGMNILVLPDGSVQYDFDTVKDAELIHMEDN